MYNNNNNNVMLTNTNTFSFWLISPIAVQTYASWCVRVCACAERERLLVPSSSCSLFLCYTLSLTLLLLLAHSTDFYLGAFGCQLLCGELHTYHRLYVRLCL